MMAFQSCGNCCGSVFMEGQTFMINKKMILFDMDGTLLPMDIEEFTQGYFKLLCKKFIPLGYDRDEFIRSVWAATKAMVENDGSRTNLDVFWKAFAEAYGERVLEDRPLFDSFYENEFAEAKDFCGFDPAVSDLLEKIWDAGFRTAVATNPIFPMTALRQRLEWAGLDPDRFEMITAYENSRYCKPNPAYYADTAARLGVHPEECLMIGNDATEDLAALKTGMDVFLLTNCLLNRENKDISRFDHGDLEALEKYIFD